jgi:hypothetical protein
MYTIWERTVTLQVYDVNKDYTLVSSTFNKFCFKQKPWTLYSSKFLIESMGLKIIDDDIIIQHNEKDGGCTSYQNALRSEIV